MSDLTTFARKLMRINQVAVRTNTPSAIFGTLGELPQALSHRASLRIGLWPCVSEKPELAMGLWAALAHLLACDGWPSRGRRAGCRVRVPGG